MKKQLTVSLVTLGLLTTGMAQAAMAQTPNPETRLNFGNQRYRGQFSLRYWYANNSIDQTFKGDSIDSFSNTKLSLGMLNLSTEHWFGILTPSGLGFLGSVFGLGLSLDYSDQLIQDTRLMSYLMDFQFAKMNLWHDADWRNTVGLSAHYVSYFNTVYDNLLLTTSAPFFGVGVGVESKHNIGDIGEASFSLVYVPSSRTPNPLPDGLGLLSEINTRWFINPNMAFNVGYRFNYFTAAGETSAQNTQTGENLTLNRTLVDMLHGVNIGFTSYF